MKTKRFESDKGTLERKGDITTIQTVGDQPWLADFGAECMNPNDEKEKHIWQKIFKDKEVFFPDEYDEVTKKFLSSSNSFTISMNGYSSISESDSRRYGVSSETYVEACASIYRSLATHLINEFPEVNIVLIDGASDMGVDKACQTVAKEVDLVQLGFSCPEYLTYVKDGNGFPVFVAEGKSQYSHRYVQSLDFLVTTGGREHAYDHDTCAVFLYRKRVLPIDIISILSTNGSMPGRIEKEDGTILIDNAAAAIENSLSMYGYQKIGCSGIDEWPNVLDYVNKTASKYCRGKMEPKFMFKKPNGYYNIAGIISNQENK